MIIAVMTTPHGNKVEITRVISADFSGKNEDIYYGYLNGEPITFLKSEVDLTLIERVP